VKELETECASILKYILLRYNPLVIPSSVALRKMACAKYPKELLSQVKECLTQKFALSG
jgi:hypothetical protein